MQNKIHDFAYAGVGLTIVYFIVITVTGLIHQTDSASMFFKSLEPFMIAAGIVLLILSLALTD
jgi:hypothetical protein